MLVCKFARKRPACKDIRVRHVVSLLVIKSRIVAEQAMLVCSPAKKRLHAKTTESISLATKPQTLHSKILWYFSVRFISTLAVLEKIMVRELRRSYVCARKWPAS